MPGRATSEAGITKYADPPPRSGLRRVAFMRLLPGVSRTVSLLSRGTVRPALLSVPGLVGAGVLSRVLSPADREAGGALGPCTRCPRWCRILCSGAGPGGPEDLPAPCAMMTVDVEICHALSR